MSNNDPVKSGLNLPKFNSTGTDDTSTEIITPKIDKATFGRRVVLISVLAITVVGMLIAALVRTPIGDVLRSGGDGKFAAPEHRID
jgi:ABC-type branched-subunit amino acid transport system permease subunit